MENNILKSYKNHIKQKNNNSHYLISTFIILFTNLMMTAKYINIPNYHIPINISYIIFHGYLIYNININIDIFNILLFYLFGIWIITLFLENRLLMFGFKNSLNINLSAWAYYIFINHEKNNFNLKITIKEILIDGPLFILLDIMRYFKISYNILENRSNNRHNNQHNNDYPLHLID